MRLPVCCSLVLTLASSALADTFHVDGSSTGCPGTGSVADPFCTIQAAIVAAVDGDLVLVHPGLYNERIDFLGKAITVKSNLGGTSARISGAGLLGSVVTFASGEGPDSVLDGFVIRDGTASAFVPAPPVTSGTAGGGVLCLGTSPTLTNNRIRLNSAFLGAGLASIGGLLGSSGTSYGTTRPSTAAGWPV